MLAKVSLRIMAENPQSRSPEEIIATLKNYQRILWKYILSFLFGPIGDDKTYSANDLRDRLWIMWGLARVAAADQFLEDLEPIVQEEYTARLPKEEPKPQICRSGLPEFKPQAQNT